MTPGDPARLAAEHGIVVSSQGGGIRVSLHACKDSSDIGTLVAALEDISQ